MRLKKKVIFLVIALMAFISVTNIFAATSAYLPVPVLTGPDGDCWVKSAAMIASYYHNIDGIDRSDSLKTLVPQNEWNTLDGIIEAIKWGTTDVYHNPAINPKKYYDSSLGSKMTTTTILNYLTNDSPIVVRIQLPYFGYHTVVLCGYNGGNNEVTYNDPLYKDQQHLGYQEFSYNWQDCVVCFLL